MTKLCICDKPKTLIFLLFARELNGKVSVSKGSFQYSWIIEIITLLSPDGCMAVWKYGSIHMGYILGVVWGRG